MVYRTSFAPNAGVSASRIPPQAGPGTIPPAQPAGMRQDAGGYEDAFPRQADFDRDRHDFREPRALGRMSPGMHRQRRHRLSLQGLMYRALKEVEWAEGLMVHLPVLARHLRRGVHGRAERAAGKLLAAAEKFGPLDPDLRGGWPAGPAPFDPAASPIVTEPDDDDAAGDSAGLAQAQAARQQDLHRQAQARQEQVHREQLHRRQLHEEQLRQQQAREAQRSQERLHQPWEPDHWEAEFQARQAVQAEIRQREIVEQALLQAQILREDAARQQQRAQQTG